MTSAYVYLRQSKDVENTRAAVDRQRADCLDLCERNRWPVAEVYEDNDASASNPRKARKDYARLLADLEHGRIVSGDVIVAWAQDRLLRKVADMLVLIDLCAKRGIAVVTVQAGRLDLATTDGQTLALMAAVIAQGEMTKKAARQRAEAEQAASDGQAPSRRAFGYRLEGKGRKRRMVLDPAEAPVVRDAFDRLLVKGQSLVRITDAVNAAGLPSVRGTTLCRKGVRYLLTNPVYAGLRTHHGEVVRDDDGEPVRGDWPAIITEDEHDRAVRLLTDAARRPAGFRGTARRWLGSGLFRCGMDGCGSDVRCGYRSPNGGNGARTYVCREHAHLSRRADVIDDLVLRAVAARLARDDARDLLAGGDDEVTALRAEADALAAALDVARDRLRRGVYDEDDFVTEKRRVKVAQEAVGRRLTAAARSSVLGTLGAAPDPAAAFTAADLGTQREVVDALAVVTLLPARRGESSFDPATVRIDWR
ncbi:Site-specific DNA recombinase [Geodermatophilus amargosae]|uniref:Site-specific DNA recombinase n=1 Tax=Geodermatophilus amargosae TaxID=1296565 RepID=A0A1I7CZB3_9ACTN|nr:recombinase family protein [Geodermatophilus amargosae]SFU04753.1 Site-specific DNA recombinase [Geodermatophilus amargosae]